MDRLVAYPDGVDSPAAPGLPMSMLLSPVVRLTPASVPNAMFKLTVVLVVSALVPTAVFSPPVLLP
jgi:hypothetical protein